MRPSMDSSDRASVPPSLGSKRNTWIARILIVRPDAYGPHLLLYQPSALFDFGVRGSGVLSTALASPIS
jgi:hypothetical protein